MYLSVRSYYLSSSSVAVVSQPASVRVRQLVLPPYPPQTILPSMVWAYLAAGSEGRVQ